MRFSPKRLNIVFCLFAGFVLTLTVTISTIRAAENRAPAVSLPATRDAAIDNNQPERFVTIDFNNVDITVFIKFISELTHKNFVIDRRVKGKVTIISPAKISIQEAYKVFESVLEVHGFAAVKAGKVIKIVPAPDARTKSVETRLREEATSSEDKVVTQLIPLKYADPNDIKRLFAPLISKSSVILAYPPTNMLIVTDVYSNIQRLVRILNAIDITGIGQEISVIPLEFADATKLVRTIETVFKAPPKAKAAAAGDEREIRLVADERTNTLVLLASEDSTFRIKKLISLLDRETPRGKEKIRVYYLEYATAEELAKVLQELPAKAGATGPAAAQAPVVSEKVKINADKATNSLIIMADQEDYQVVEEIIKKLDIPRSMVYIEALVIEVDTSKDFRLGTEWIAGGETIYNETKAIYGGGFSGGAAGGDPGYSSIPPPVAGASAPLPPGFSLGVFSEAIQIGNIVFPNLTAVFQAYRKDKDVQFLSTPQILTMDNEEAKIVVGKNIPFQTKSTAVSGGEIGDAYSSFEYRDVGKTLKITPHISKDRLVRLNISLEVTALESTTDFRPTTLKRTIDTTVIVKDTSTVVIGGLIDDNLSLTEYKVPCLGDIPGLKWLFSSMSRVGEKTNLYIFLTPHVVKGPAEAEELYGKKKGQLEEIKEGQIKMYQPTETK